jgi:hypothetical protein
MQLIQAMFKGKVLQKMRISIKLWVHFGPNLALPFIWVVGRISESSVIFLFWSKFGIIHYRYEAHSLVSVILSRILDNGLHLPP